MQLDPIDKALVHFPFLDRVLFHVGETPVTVASVALAAVVLGLTWLTSRLLRRGVQRALQLRGISDEGSIAAARRLAHYAVGLVGLLLALRALGVDLSTLFAAGAVFALGIGFALQNITQNFVSGVILLLERSITPGDVLEVEGQFMKVHRMGIRTTVATTLDDEEIIVPNATIVQSTVKNFTLADTAYRLRATVGVAYESDMALVRKVLESTARDVSWRIQDREPLVTLLEFGSSAVNWEVSVWIDDPWRARRARGTLHEQIWKAFRDAGIRIAFPQMDVHLDRGVERSLAAMAATP
jgi:small-conductance mechanosensitive channel